MEISTMRKFYFEQRINLKQGKLTVDEYTCRYQELETLCGLWESDKNDGAHYIKGLRQDIRAKVDFCEPIPRSVQGSYSC